MKRSVVACGLAAVAGLVAGLAAFGDPGVKPAPGEGALPKPRAQTEPAKAPTNMDKPTTHILAERIAKRLIAASPVVDPADAKARDEAAEKLAAIEDLTEAAHGRILWGGYNPPQGYDPAAYRLVSREQITYNQLTEFSPEVWAKMYLSTFMFPGTYEIRQEGNFTVLELDARFRGGMDPGEYPYPFWHSPTKWTAYVKAEKVALVFEPGRLLSAMRVSPDPRSINVIKKPWDEQWTWTDEEGNPQPRVALFTYVFSKDNPHVSKLDESYRSLEGYFREQNCLTCHSPDNRGKINDLLLLNYPNQALIARRTLVAILEDNQMPPGSELAHEPTGIQDERVRQEMIKLAKAFEREANAAFAYEELQKASEGAGAH